MFCPKCGKKAEGSSYFCNSCGAKMNNMPQEEQNKLFTEQGRIHKEAHVAKEAKVKGQKKKNTIYLGGCLGGLFLVLCLFIVFLKVKEGRIIKAYNERLEQLDQMINKHTQGIKKEEYQHSLEAYYELLEQKDIEKLEFVEGEIRELEKKVANYSKEMMLLKNYEGAFEDLKSYCCLNEENQIRLELLEEELYKSIESGDLEGGQVAVRDLKAFKKYIIEDNKKQIQLLKKQLQEMDLANSYDAEKQRIQKLKEQAEALLQAEKYREALEKLKESQALGKIASSYSPYELKISQVDVSDYPVIRLYTTLQDVRDKIAKDNLKVENFYIAERLKGQQDYITIPIKQVSMLNEKEKINISLVVDVSGSMIGAPMMHAQAVMSHFINQVQFQAGDEVALISFADDVYSEVPFTNDKQILLDNLNTMGGGDLTSLYDALYVAIHQVAMQSGAKCIIAFTDGIDNDSVCTPQIIAELAMRYHIPIFIIGVGESIDSFSMQYITSSTGGGYRSIDTIPSMQEVYEVIYREQKAMYLIEYQVQQGSEVDEREVYINYMDKEITTRTQGQYSPAILMEASKPTAQLFIKDFIIYDSDSRYITVADLEQLSPEQLRLARNEIYARRGRKFIDSQLMNYFMSKEWYTPLYETDYFDESCLNDYERANAYFIRDYENLHGFNH